MPDSSPARASFGHRAERAETPDAMHLIVSPVGADTDLRAALEDLKLGRYLATRDLLARTGLNWSLRTSRSQLLAAGAGNGGVFKLWLDEEPGSADAAMMWARVLTRAALAAHRKGKSTEFVGRAASLARDACSRAMELEPRCPVPWICLLHLTHFDPQARAPHQSWDLLGDTTMPHRGPWPILGQINWRHPGSREGHHRMREFFLHHCGPESAMDYTGWLVSRQQVNPGLLMLPLYALVDIYLAQHGHGQSGALRFWQAEQVLYHACRARDGWFALVPPVERRWLPVMDLSYLAYVLVACGEDARDVFEAMGPYAVSQPWQDVNTSLGRTYDWRTEFLHTRAYVLGAA
jgi:hypothetical protein